MPRKGAAPELSRVRGPNLPNRLALVSNRRYVVNANAAQLTQISQLFSDPDTESASGFVDAREREECLLFSAFFFQRFSVLNFPLAYFVEIAFTNIGRLQRISE
jgi:hypothetical protein